MLLSVSHSGLRGAEPYRDPQGRFALELPANWEFKKEQLHTLFRFGPKGGVACCLVTCYPGVINRHELFSTVVETATSAGHSEPPVESVVDMTLNGLPARLAEYESSIKAGAQTVKMHVLLGGVVSEADDLGIAFSVYSSPADFQKHGEAIRACFESLRVPNRPKIGVSGVVEVKGSITKPRAPTMASAFKHDLISLTLPPGWRAETSKLSMIIANLKHENYGTITLTGGAKNKFGKNREEILGVMSSQMMASMPLMKETRGGWEVRTSGGGSAILKQYDGAITVLGQEFPHGAIVAALKDAKRGIGLMGVFRSETKEAALKDILSIIESAR